jgi:DnaJ-class molecular chaperone
VSADDDQPAEIPCPPCRATGKVISNLGGTAQQIDCPWCEGTGRLAPGGDAQAKWPANEPDGPAAA